MFGTLENAVKRLFSRDTHLQFGFGSLLTMLVIYFLLICWATGTSVASGALVPMLWVNTVHVNGLYFSVHLFPSWPFVSIFNECYLHIHFIFNVIQSVFACESCLQCFFDRLVGGLYGRAVGLLMTYMFGVHSEDFGYWAWMDPGVFSLIGAASFFGGVTRLALAVTVIMVFMIALFD